MTRLDRVTDKLLPGGPTAGPDDFSASPPASPPPSISKRRRYYTHQQTLVMHVDVPLESLENSEDADNAHLRAQGHQAALERRFSPLAVIGLGFRYVLDQYCVLFESEDSSITLDC